MAYEIRLKPGVPHRYVKMISPLMEVTHEWQSIQEYTREIEQRVKIGQVEVAEKREAKVKPFTETIEAPQPVTETIEKPVKARITKRKKKGE